MDELYQSQILALARFARQSSIAGAPTHSTKLKNPLCGDEVHLSAIIQDDIITDASVTVSGCALCEAGAGLWLQLASQQPLHHMPAIAQSLTGFLASDGEDIADDRLAPLTAIRPVKNRHKCVTLAAQASIALTKSS